jgi:hypothetical protein
MPKLTAAESNGVVVLDAPSGGRGPHLPGERGGPPFQPLVGGDQ